MHSLTVLLVLGCIVSALSANARLPTCSCDGLSCECCTNFQFRRRQRDVCIRAEYNPSQLGMNVDIIVDGVQLATRAIGADAIPICVPIPGLTLCLTNRKVSVNTAESAKLCPTLDVKKGPLKIYSSTLPCMTMSGGLLLVGKE